VESNFLTVLALAIDEMVDMGRDLIPNALEVNPHELQPIACLTPKPSGLEVDLVDDDDVDNDVAATTVGPSL
jgi:hypothetical protein